MTNKAKQIMEQGGIALKSTAFPPVPEMVEMLAYCGIDIVELNWEYSPLDIQLIANNVRAAEAAGVTLQVKVRELNQLDPVLIWDILDTGAKGILLPGVKSAAEVKEAVSIIRHPPKGRRRKNIWWGRASRHGTQPWAERVKSDQDIIVGAEIETAEAVNNVDAILAVDGLTYISVGHTDLAYNVGRYPAKADDSVVVELFNRVVAGARRQKKVKMNASLAYLGLEAASSPWMARPVEDIIADEVVGMITCAPFPNVRLIRSLTTDVDGYRAVMSKKGRFKI